MPFDTLVFLAVTAARVGWKSAECGVRSAECGKRGVWKLRSMDNAECGECGVK